MKKSSLKYLSMGMIGVLVAIIIMLLPLSTDIKIRVKYAKANSSYKSVLYVDNGKGFNDSQKVQRRIKKTAVTFKLKKEYSNIGGLRFDPVDAPCADAITVKEVVVYAYDGLAKKYSAEQLGEVLLPENGVTVLSCDEQGLAFLCEGEDPQFVFSPEAMRDIQKSFSKNNTIALFVLYLFLAGLVVVAFRERIKTICFGDKKKTAVTAGQISYFTVLCLLEQNAYAGHLGFRMQTALLLGILLLSVIARLVFCASEKRKPVATCAAVTILAETVYGSSFGGKVFETFAPDAMLYLVAVVCAVLFLGYCLWNGKDAAAFLWVFGTVSVFQFSACIFSYEYTLSEAFEKTFHYWSQHQCMITTLALTGFFMLLRGVLGKGIALVMYTIVYLVFQVGNLIEMIYHQSVFKPLDFLAFTEAVDVAKNYLNPVTVTVMAVCFLVCVFCLWKFRRQILEFLRPATNGASFVFGAMLLLWVFSSLYHNVYSEWWIYSHYTWGSESARLKKQGYVPYFYYYSMRTKDVFPEEPENYSEETIQTILSSVESDSGESGEETSGSKGVKPDVIYLMLESVFDVDELEKYGVTYSEDPNPTLDRYQISTALTTVYGGLTARAEFEALMGLSGSFYPNGTVEYLTFWGSDARERYSVVNEFERNGYTSCAIHQNVPNYYNRTNAYTGMGFDKYISSDTYGEDLEPEDRNEDKYLTNVHFMKLLKQELETDPDTPKFIWGITIESHTPYMDKYTETDIEAKCDKLSDSAEKELTNYIQSVKRTDEFFAELIAYVEQRERPTVIVMFGDHRPPLEALDVIGANAEYAEKYATACYAYSNFGEIKPPAERISINYIPALVVEYAGIEKSGFYNYLYDLQKRHPVVSYIFPDETFTAEQENYKLLQYDIMFGEGYCGK